MKYEIRYKPSYSLLEVQLAQDETVVAEAGAMTYFSPNVEAKTRIRSGGILSSLGMTLLERQSFFVRLHCKKRPWKDRPRLRPRGRY